MNAGDLFHVIDGGVDDDADTGRGAIVLVHGSWTDHASWQFVRPLLAEDHVVVSPRWLVSFAGVGPAVAVGGGRELHACGS